MTESGQEIKKKVLPSQIEKNLAKHSLEHIDSLTGRTTAVRKKLKNAKNKNSLKLENVRSFIVSAAKYTDTYGALGTGEEYGQRIKIILLLSEADEAKSDLEVEELWNKKRVEVEMFTKEFNGLMDDVFKVEDYILPIVEEVVEGKDIDETSLNDTKEVFYAYCVATMNLLGLFPKNNNGYKLAKEIASKSEVVDIYFQTEAGEEQIKHHQELRNEFESLKVNLNEAREILIRKRAGR